LETSVVADASSQNCGAAYIALQHSRFNDYFVADFQSLMRIAGLQIHRLKRTDLPEDTPALARWLLGKLVVRRDAEGVTAGRIVETEAYMSDDPACHAHIGPTPRNRTLFLRRGHAYVYLAYGTSWMLNVSSGAEGEGAGVLIRAVEPVAGVPLMIARRGTDKLRDLTRGPGRVAQALAIDRSLDGLDLTADARLWLGAEAGAAECISRAMIGVSTRIGLTKGVHLEHRFFLKGNPFVSGPRALNR
jgi:DNA-3-methyladenine glycosylase